MMIRDTFKDSEMGADDFRDGKPAPELPNDDFLDKTEYIGDSNRELIELPEIVPYGEAEIERKGSLHTVEGDREQRDLYAPSMEMQAEKIKAIFEVTPELQYDNWKNLDINERKKVLNDFEKSIAKVEMRIPMPVGYEKLSGGVMGYTDGRKLVVSERVLKSNDYSDYKETLNTLFHEGRHSYQNYNLYVKRTEQSDEIFNSWVVNRKKLGYSSGDVSFPFNMSESFRQKSYYQYYTQPVEVDARLFAETVERKIGL
ncbi:MAG: hypothetical protein K6A90_07015 [Lachnospiraceae bacterium]|nr:hypothetical protein [Lachnospiraceae bacterium]